MGFWDWFKRAKPQEEEPEERVDSMSMYASSEDYEREKKRKKKEAEDNSFDATGMVLGMATGLPIGPRGITTGAILGAAMHSNNASAEEEDRRRRQSDDSASANLYTPMTDYGRSYGDSSPSPTYSHESSHSSYSSSSSYDSGSSSGGGSDSGGGGGGSSE